MTSTEQTVQTLRLVSNDVSLCRVLLSSVFHENRVFLASAAALPLRCLRLIKKC